jgi:hypothetical protein
MCFIAVKHRMRAMQAKAQDKKERPMFVRHVMPVALVLVAACSSSAPPSTYYRPTPTQAVKASQDSVDTPEWLRQREYRDGGPIPPMEANRKVNEQPCTEGVPPGSGNLKCR